MSTTTHDEITAQQYADEFGVSIASVYQNRWLGVGPLSYKRNGRITFRRSDIESYLERQRARTLRGEGV